MGLGSLQSPGEGTRPAGTDGHGDRAGPGPAQAMAPCPTPLVGGPCALPDTQQSLGCAHVSPASTAEPRVLTRSSPSPLTLPAPRPLWHQCRQGDSQAGQEGEWAGVRCHCWEVTPCQGAGTAHAGSGQAGWGPGHPPRPAASWGGGRAGRAAGLSWEHRESSRSWSAHRRWGWSCWTGWGPHPQGLQLGGLGCTTQCHNVPSTGTPARGITQGCMFPEVAGAGQAMGLATLRGNQTAPGHGCDSASSRAPGDHEGGG